MATEEMKRKKRKYITLRELCDGLEIPLPKEYEDIADEPQTLCFRSKWVKPGDICLIIRSAEDFQSKAMSTQVQYDFARERQAKLIIMGKDAFEAFHLKKEDYPVILMDDANRSVMAFLSKLRAVQTGKFVTITGSIGKTTTKDLCYCVTKNHFHALANPNNTNTPHQVAKRLFAYSYRPYELYIQETGAGYRGSVRFASEILRPDYFILTNVYNHHMQVYETFENLFEDKVSPDDCLSENGLVITNYDDPHIREHTFKHKVISFGVDSEDVDFRAINVKQDKDMLSMDILEAQTESLTHVEVNILGTHNAYNILAAFALARALGVSCEDISKDLRGFQTAGVRQMFTNIGGTYINMDCYNVSEESILSMLQAGEDFTLDEGCRKIALLGGENKLGKGLHKRSRQFGETLANIQFDQFLFCGPRTFRRTPLNMFGDACDIRKGFRKVSEKPNELITNLDKMTKRLQETVHRGDLLMAKGIFMLDMPIAVDKAFGTSFAFELSHNKEAMEKVQKDGYEAIQIPAMGDLEIRKAPVVDGNVKIPDRLCGNKIHRIGPKAFKNNKEVKKVEFGATVKNIGNEAFRGCTQIRSLRLPGNLRVIEEAAFAGCRRLKKVTIEEGATHIAKDAFARCGQLQTIEIPDSVGMIEEGAFEESEHAVIVCSKNSFAYEYAISNNIKVEIKD